MQKPKIVLIEDEADIAALIKLQADISGYKLFIEADGLMAIASSKERNRTWCCWILCFQDKTVLDVCRKLKANPDLKDIPVIMISAKSEEIDVILGLELGADDYVPSLSRQRFYFRGLRRFCAVGRSRKSRLNSSLLVISQWKWTAIS